MSHFAFLPDGSRTWLHNGAALDLDRLTLTVLEHLRGRSAEAPDLLRELEALLGPSNGVRKGAEEVMWALVPPDLTVYHCDRCGALWLQPSCCCGEESRPAPAPYYVASRAANGAGRWSAPDFSVIMLTKDRLELTRAAVESLRRAHGTHSVEYIFVDCASTDGSLNYFQELAKRETVQVIVTHPEEPFVYARNCNRGAQAARGGYLLFANNDIDNRDPQLFAKLGRALEDARTGVVGTLTTYDCSNELQSQPHLPRERVWSTKPVMGFFWGVRAGVFSELGGLDESFTGYGCDEIDFEYRAVRRNYRIAVVDSVVHHALHATFGTDTEPSLLQSIQRFNRKHGCDLRHGGQWYYPFLVYPYPRISVAIACRNHGGMLPRALDSVLDSYLPAEFRRQVVVVNDASQDETAGVLESYQQQEPEQVNVIHRALSRGPAAAKNQAMARCVGDYVALLDADDEFLPYKLQRCLEALETTGADFLYHDFVFVLPDGRHLHDAVGQWTPERWRGGRNLPPCTWAFRNGAVRFSEEYVTGEDPEFLRRAWSRLKTVYLPEALSRYYAHPGSLSSRAMCRVVTGQLKGAAMASVRNCSDI